MLKPGGELLFIEHDLSPDARVAAWQHRLTPLWRPLAGGCHLDRPIETLVRSAGLNIAGLQKSSFPGPKPFVYMYEGPARA